MVIRAIHDWKSLQSLKLMSQACKNIAGYLSHDKLCTKFREGDDGRLYHLGSGPNQEVVQLVVPIGLRGPRHSEARRMQRPQGYTLDQLKRKYFWPLAVHD